MVTILFQTESHFPVNKNTIRKSIENHLKTAVHRNSEVSVSIVGDRAMKRLNKMYRKLDSTTDVLSFPQHDTAADKNPFIEPPDNILRLGDIVVSYPEAVAEATEANKLVDDVIVELVLHGLDHLLGIHHPE